MRRSGRLGWDCWPRRWHTALETWTGPRWTPHSAEANVRGFAGTPAGYLVVDVDRSTWTDRRGQIDVDRSGMTAGAHDAKHVIRTHHLGQCGHRARRVAWHGRGHECGRVARAQHLTRA